MMDLFKDDIERVDKMNISWNEFQIDFSKIELQIKRLTYYFN